MGKIYSKGEKASWRKIHLEEGADFLHHFCRKKNPDVSETIDFIY